MDADPRALTDDFGFWALRAGSQPENWDPYPTYRRLRERHPVWQSPWGDWYVSSFSGVSSAFLSPHCRRSAPAGREGLSDGSTAIDLTPSLRRWFVFLDPPQHTRLRQAFAVAFSETRTATVAPAIADIARRLIADAPVDRFDFVDAIAAPLPPLVIAQMLALPASDGPLLASWARLLRQMLDSGENASDATAAATINDMDAYFVDVVRDPAWRRAWAEVGPKVWESHPEELIAASLALLAFGGHETTVHLIGSMVLHLGLRPSLWERLRGRPDGAGSAVLETLRFESPVQKICRWTTQTTSIDGVAVPADQSLVFLLGAAHRDPARFADPDRFDLDRNHQPHVAFGWGAHLCIGRTLALLEATTVLRCLVESWRKVTPVEGGRLWYNNSSFRGLQRLDIVVEP